MDREMVNGQWRRAEYALRILGFLIVIAGSLCASAEAASAIRSEMQRLSGDLPEIANPFPGVQYNFNLNQEAFYVHVPPNYDGTEPFGLLVFIYSRNAYTIPPGWPETLAERKLVYVAPQNVGNSQLMTRRCGIATVAALKLIERLNIDPGRVYISGYSGGGWAACQTAFIHDDIFKGVIPICGIKFYKRVEWVYTEKPFDYGYFELDERMGERVRGKVRFAVITGSGDHRRNPIRDVFHGGYERYEFDAKLFDIPGMGHTLCSGTILNRALDFIERPAPIGPLKKANTSLPEETEAVVLVKRTWKSSSGYEMQAGLLKVEGGLATLRREDGRTVEIEIESFSPADQETLKGFLGTTTP